LRCAWVRCRGKADFFIRTGIWHPGYRHKFIRTSGEGLEPFWPKFLPDRRQGTPQNGPNFRPDLPEGYQGIFGGPILTIQWTTATFWKSTTTRKKRKLLQVLRGSIDFGLTTVEIQNLYFFRILPDFLEAHTEIRTKFWPLAALGLVRIKIWRQSPDKNPGPG
jgi:hypothetical protein